MAKKDYQISVAAHVLRYARTSLGLTVEEAMTQLDIAQHELEDLETGTQQPKISQLRSMAKVYKRSLTFLLLADVPQEKPVPRDLRTVDSKKLGHFKPKTILAVRKARALAESQIDLLRAMDMAVPKFNMRGSLNEDAAERGKAIREVLELHHLRAEGITAKQALEHTIEAVTGLGVLVFQLTLTQDGLRGFSILDEEIPVIVMKRGSETVTARLFTLFHELGHVMLGDGGMCDLHETNSQTVEKWCNTFAAEALLPSSEVRQHEVVRKHLADALGMEWSKQELALIAKDYHVSLEVVLRRLLTERLTSKKFYEENHEKWKDKAFGRAKKGQTRDTVASKIQERGRPFVRLIFSAIDRERIGPLQASQLLDVPMDRFAHARQLVA
ncbi:MAG: ImmA/IrrE family metallo-endopeptidase [Flavobacteriales bacterium]|nr:ImmA/IrrE family metallo-endopeptidase [Flavobacteriales bacterium]